MSVQHDRLPRSQPGKLPPAKSWVHWLVLFGVALAGIALDQMTKAYAAAHLALYESWAPVEALRPVFKITLTHNTGVAFGLFKDGGAIFVVIPVIVSAIIVFYYRQLPPGQWLIRVALGLQMAGALGNFIDRVRLGYVVDFLHVTYWPVFNVADSCIVVGVGLLLLMMLLEDWRARQSAREPHEPPISDPGEGVPG